MSIKPLQNSFTIDANDRVVAVDKDWDEFADENNGEAAMGKHVMNHSIWTFISGETTKHVYEQMLSEVRRGITISFNFRCDSPSLRRFFEMVISPLPDDHVKFETFIQRRSEPREIDGVEIPVERSEPIITCSWCRKVSTGNGVWHKVKDAVELLSMFETSSLLSHGICPECYDGVIDQIAKERRKV
jgi:hypothetical protein